MDNIKKLSEFNNDDMFFIAVDGEDCKDEKEILTKEEILSGEYPAEKGFVINDAVFSPARFDWAEVLRLIEDEYGQYDGWVEEMLAELEVWNAKGYAEKFLDKLFAENRAYY